MKTNPSLKTPITYYGGKQNMVRHILPLLPEHHRYVEPFFGGGAVFFAKPPSAYEVVNDTNHRLMAFYRALKYDFEGLSAKVDETFHSRAQHGDSKDEYKAGVEGEYEQLVMAWAVWVQTNMSFGSKIGSGFARDMKGQVPVGIHNKKNRFTDTYQQRMRSVTIECYDVLKVIRLYDAPDTFFYLDPPYVSSNQGHYGGYTLDDFRALLDVCAQMQGKFLLSSYPEPLLLQYRQERGWQQQNFTQALAVDNRRKERKDKVECLTWNY